MEFIFDVTPYEKHALVGQVSGALEKRTELLSREKMPTAWELIDRLGGERVSAEIMKKRRTRRRIFSTILLILGIFMLVPGLMRPQEGRLLLVAGAVAAAIGVAFLLVDAKKRPSKFDKAAERILDGLKNAPEMKVVFSEDGVAIEGKVDVTYGSFDFIAETEDLFLFTWAGKFTVLKKSDMTEGDVDAFRDFIEQQAPDATKIQLL